jgi:hypothetical protein
MLSANIVAQKPAGKVSPLSFSGHPWLLVWAPTLGWSDIHELQMHKALMAATTGSRVLNRLKNRMSTPYEMGRAKGEGPYFGYAAKITNGQTS